VFWKHSLAIGIGCISGAEIFFRRNFLTNSERCLLRLSAVWNSASYDCWSKHLYLFKSTWKIPKIETMGALGGRFKCGWALSYRLHLCPQKEKSRIGCIGTLHWAREILIFLACSPQGLMATRCPGINNSEQLRINCWSSGSTQSWIGRVFQKHSLANHR